MLRHREPYVMTLQDVGSILSAAMGSELEAIVAFSIGTGLRRSETCGLKWSDLDLETGTIRVQRAAVNVGGKVLIKATKTKTSRRTDYLSPFVVNALRRLRTEQARRHDALGIFRLGEDRFVFDRDGQPWNPNELSRHFSRMVRKNTLPAVRFHDLRHGYATLAFAAGVPLKVVSESLGHSTIGVTSAIYVHLLDQTKRDKADALEAYLGPALQALPKASADR